jgi:glycerol-3-phosphate acyltransferase PlsY
LAVKGILWIIAGYFIGSIPFGLLVSLGIYKQDLRKLGSGNIGATNVLRNFGTKPFIAVLILDMGKGYAAVRIGQALGLSPSLALAAGMAAMVGHMWSVFLRFKGGKGIATGGGVIIAAYPWQVTLIVIGSFLIMLLITRIMSVGSITGAIAFPVSAFIFLGGDMSQYWFHLVVAVMGCTFAVYKHRDNIRRLIRGEEPKLKFKRTRTEGAGA